MHAVWGLLTGGVLAETNYSSLPINQRFAVSSVRPYGSPVSCAIKAPCLSSALAGGSHAICSALSGGSWVSLDCAKSYTHGLWAYHLQVSWVHSSMLHDQCAGSCGKLGRVAIPPWCRIVVFIGSRGSSVHKIMYVCACGKSDLIPGTLGGAACFVAVGLTQHFKYLGKLDKMADLKPWHEFNTL